MRRSYILLLFLFQIFSACVWQDNKLVVTGLRSAVSGPSVQVSAVQINASYDKIIINGSNLDKVTLLQIQTKEAWTLSFDSQSSSQIVASILNLSASALNLAMETSYNLLISTAYATTPVIVTFTLPNNSVTTNHILNGTIAAVDLATMGAATGQFLQFNGINWSPASIATGLTYKGTWNANTDVPNLVVTNDCGGAVVSGEYYIVDTNGATNVDGISSWSKSDWIVCSSSGSYQKIVGAAPVLALDDITNVSATTPVTNDLLQFNGSNWTNAQIVINQLSDVDTVTSPPVLNQVLKWDGVNWTPQADALGSGAVASVNTQSGIVTLDTDDITEGVSNYYFTQARARTAVSASNGISYISGTGVFSANFGTTATTVAAGNHTHADATLVTSGFMSATDKTKLDNLATDAIQDADFSANGYMFRTGAGTYTTVASVSDATKLPLGGGTMSGAIAMGTSKITGLGEPTLAQDAATKNYVDATITSSSTPNYWTKTGSDIYYSAGIVGIGTSAPTQLLTVQNNQNASTQILLNNNNAGAAAEAMFAASNGTKAIYFGVRGTAETAYGQMAASEGQVYTADTSLNLMADGAASIMKFATGGSAERMRIDASGNVGIGTTTPATKLDVYKNATGTTIRLVGSAAGTVQDSSIDFAMVNATPVNYGRIAAQAVDGSAGVEKGSLIFSTTQNGTLAERLRIDNLGNVGIGTNNPSHALHVVGSTKISTVLNGCVQADATGVLSSTGVACGSGGGGITSVSASTPLISSGGATPNISMAAATTSVDGYLTSTNWNTFNNKQNTITTGTTAQYLKGDLSLGTFGADVLTTLLTGYSASNATILSTDSVLMGFNKAQGQINAHTTSISGKADTTNVTQTITALVVTGLSAPIAGSDAANKTYVDTTIASSSTPNYWTKTASDITYNSGNVGIGTTGSFMSKLHVFGTEATTYSVTSGATHTPATLQNSMTIQNNQATDNTGSFLQFISRNNASNNNYGYIGTVSNTATYVPSFVFGVRSGPTAYSERMRLDQNGNLGIGTNTPTSKLQVEGGISYGSSTLAKSTSCILTYSVNTATPAVLTDCAGNAMALDRQYRLKAWVPGTSTLTGASAVVNSNGATFNLLKDFEYAQTSNNIEFYLNSGIPTVRLWSHAGLYNVQVLTEELDYNLNSNRGNPWGEGIIYKNGAGYVGIGTTVPSSPLTVYATRGEANIITSVATDFSRLYLTNTGGSMTLAMERNSGGALAVGSIGFAAILANNNNAPVQLATNSQTRMTVTGAGDVGIGTTIPSNTLHVVGSAKISTVLNGCVTADATGVLSSTGSACGTGSSTVSSVSGTAPLVVTNGTTTPLISMAAATTSVDGYLTSANWNTFNGKQNAITTGTTAQYLKGDLSLGTFMSDVRGTTLTGLSASTAAVTAADTVLQAMGKLANTQGDYVSKTVSSNISAGTLSIGAAAFLTVPTPVSVNDAVNKSYVDTSVASASTALWSLASGNVYRASGNVGIGTSNPLTTLNINAGGGVNLRNESGTGKTIHALLTGTADSVSGGALHPTLQISSAPLGILGMYTGEVFFTKRSGLTYADYGSGVRGLVTSVSDARNNGLAFFTSSSSNINGDAMVIDHLGNVGIGTSAPAGILNLSSDGNTYLYNEAYNTAGGSPLFITKKARGTRAVPSAVASGDRLGGFHTMGYGATGFVGTNSTTAIDSWAEETFTDTAMGAFINFGTTNIGSIVRTEKMRISANGNVGIGTTTPVAPLTLNTTGITATTIGAKENRLFFLNPSTTVNNGAEIVVGAADTTTGRYAVIGTNIIANAANSATGDIYLATKATTGATTLTPNVYIQGSSGNVGIGTTGPVEMLDVNGAIVARGQVSANSPSMIALDFSAGNGRLVARGPDSSTNAGFVIATTRSDGTNVLVPLQISTAGNVGINATPSATHKLQVTGTAGLSTGTAWTNTSDRRLKDIHGKYEYGLDEILKLDVVKFSYKVNNPLGLPSDKEIVGFVAQDVEKVIPEAIVRRDDGYLELNVDPIHWAMVNAFKDVDKRFTQNLQQFEIMKNGLEELRADMKEAKRAIASLKEEVQNLKKHNKDLEEAVCAINPRAKFCLKAAQKINSR